MTMESHLTEDERQMLADGSLAPERRQRADSHIRACPECSADVERIRALVRHVKESAVRDDPQATAIDELWPSIRARIEERKVLPMPGALTDVPAPRFRSRRWLLATAGVAAASLLALWAMRDRQTPVEITSVPAASDSGLSLVAAVDSTRAYEQEVQALLNHLELQRATLRPELARAFQRDLREIDVAIAELKEAIARDPANPALRQLLAASYRQKLDLLKRVNNAS